MIKFKDIIENIRECSGGIVTIVNKNSPEDFLMCIKDSLEDYIIVDFEDKLYTPRDIENIEKILTIKLNDTKEKFKKIVFVRQIEGFSVKDLKLSYKRYLELLDSDTTLVVCCDSNTTTNAQLFPSMQSETASLILHISNNKLRVLKSRFKDTKLKNTIDLTSLIRKMKLKTLNKI